jgi:hypothetical protein
MERKRLQQLRFKLQQRFCVSQQDLPNAIVQIKPQRRATQDYSLIISSSPTLSTSSVETVIIPSVTKLIKEFEARTQGTPYVSAQDFVPSNAPESNYSQQISERRMSLKTNDQFTGDTPQYKRDLSSSSYHSVESSHNTNEMSTPTNRINEIRAKEAELNNALADLISLSNDPDIASSMSSSSRSLIYNFQHRRTSSVTENTNSISTSIALLNHLLETFDMDIEKIKKENNDKHENLKPINIFR